MNKELAGNPTNKAIYVFGENRRKFLKESQSHERDSQSHKRDSQSHERNVAFSVVMLITIFIIHDYQYILSISM